MKVLALNGSQNPKGVTYHAIQLVADELSKENIGLDIVHVGVKPLAGCLDCRKCRTNGHHCIHNDIVNKIIDMLPDYDGLILGCPVHYMGIPGPFKAALDRLLYATEHLEGWGPKPATAIAVCRRAGAVNTAQQLGNYLNCANLLTVNSQYWNIVFGWKPEEFLEQDAEGVQTMKVLGRNMAWILKVIEASKGSIPAPVYEKRVRANFCR
ncbi:flavodoxin family protein [uncultured Mailhella sp.]|uniref:flavodoxin family protein n=1 Tax=uncultured Mailhella sp. TaxID=1981031 RepID=UPI0025F9DA50|nr:flavodoxin family protein [uncultured Mailhella sp.]